MKIIQPTEIDYLNTRALEARQLCIKYGALAGPQGAHYGPALSMSEIMTVVLDIANLRLPSDHDFKNRDRVILSKGHGSLALYVSLFQKGFINESVMETCEQDGTLIPGQPIRNNELGVEFSSGSLGMGLGFGVGLALSARMDQSSRRIFVIMGDGETNEGSVWESAMSAAQFELSNLVAIIDANDMQSDGNTNQVMRMNHEELWSAAGWDTFSVDGHSVSELYSAINSESSKPIAIIANTTKGKGVSFMEGSADWHHGFLSPDLMTQAKEELGF
jgi:transketolase